MFSKSSSVLLSVISGEIKLLTSSEKWNSIAISPRYWHLALDPKLLKNGSAFLHENWKKILNKRLSSCGDVRNTNQGKFPTCHYVGF